MWVWLFQSPGSRQHRVWLTLWPMIKGPHGDLPKLPLLASHSAATLSQGVWHLPIPCSNATGNWGFSIAGLFSLTYSYLHCYYFVNIDIAYDPKDGPCAESLHLPTLRSGTRNTAMWLVGVRIRTLCHDIVFPFWRSTAGNTYPDQVKGIQRLPKDIFSSLMWWPLWVVIPVFLFAQSIRKLRVKSVLCP